MDDEHQTIVQLIIQVQEMWLGGFTPEEAWNAINCMSSPSVIAGVFAHWDKDIVNAKVPVLPGA